MVCKLGQEYKHDSLFVWKFHTAVCIVARGLNTEKLFSIRRINSS